MEDTLSIVFAVIVALIIMFIVPLMDVWEMQDNLSYVVTYAAVTDFVDTVRNTGYISMNNYNTFVSILNSTGNRFDITMEHRAMSEDIARVMHDSSQTNPASRSATPYLNRYSRAIIDSLQRTGIYNLEQYDYFYVTVKNTNKTQASVINNLVAHDDSNFKIGCAYGGIVWSVRDE